MYKSEKRGNSKVYRWYKIAVKRGNSNKYRWIGA
jgi:hypothetical protein